jgi:hypothetical protein
MHVRRINAPVSTTVRGENMAWKKEQGDLLLESMQRSVEILKEVQKKMNSGQSSKVAFQWRDDESLKVWSKYVLFCVKEHSETLLQKRRNILTKGDYGEVDIEPWWKEIRYFLSEAMLVDENVMNEIGVHLISLVDPFLNTLEKTAQPQLQDVSVEDLTPPPSRTLSPLRILTRRPPVMEKTYSGRMLTLIEKKHNHDLLQTVTPLSNISDTQLQN